MYCSKATCSNKGLGCGRYPGRPGKCEFDIGKQFFLVELFSCSQPFQKNWSVCLPYDCCSENFACGFRNRPICDSLSLVPVSRGVTSNKSLNPICCVVWLQLVLVTYLKQKRKVWKSIFKKLTVKHIKLYYINVPSVYSHELYQTFLLYDDINFHHSW